MSWAMVFWFMVLVLVGSAILRVAGKFTRQALGWVVLFVVVAMGLRHISEVTGLVAFTADTFWPVLRQGVEAAVRNSAELIRALINSSQGG
ncbi:MAG: hypothetical protein C4575_12510 [Desulforudis sp.]|nr:MAG: hypothetical protein C4575_12510 [Desulforudis sp.]